MKKVLMLILLLGCQVSYASQKKCDIRLSSDSVLVAGVMLCITGSILNNYAAQELQKNRNNRIASHIKSAVSLGLISGGSFLIGCNSAVNLFCCEKKEENV